MGLWMRNVMRVCVEVTRKDDRLQLPLGPPCKRACLVDVLEELGRLKVAQILALLPSLRVEVGARNHYPPAVLQCLESGHNGGSPTPAGGRAVDAHKFQALSPPREHHSVGIVAETHARRAVRHLECRFVARCSESGREEISIVVHLLQGQDVCVYAQDFLQQLPPARGPVKHTLWLL
eukprot:CAMPEP_0185193434 /NCGR_PEP_ID=MMETSP1140-20130426/25841_1 /TAXON_ID=298111 /ORGANISM="Pavlova sp., Strain CCMP459" /LENGTH=177 /DNA_ID=CAMNT_0027760257 /DNA_START=722 /DNA_END=1255 /DNA_ORIENTATION=+